MDKTQLFNILIEIGRDKTIPRKEELADKGLTTRIMLPSGWDRLQGDVLILLFRGLVIMEEYWFTHGDHIGSTTDTKFVYREIKSRGLDPDDEIGNWAFQYSSNPYVPLDTGNRHGAKDIFEFFAWREAYLDRVFNERKDSILRKAEKKRLNAEAHAERLKQKEIRDLK